MKQVVAVDLTQAATLLLLFNGVLAQIGRVPSGQGQGRTLHSDTESQVGQRQNHFNQNNYRNSKVPNTRQEPPISWQREELLPVNTSRSRTPPWLSRAKDEAQYDGSGISKQEADKIRQEMMNKEQSLRESPVSPVSATRGQAGIQNIPATTQHFRKEKLPDHQNMFQRRGNPPTTDSEQYRSRQQLPTPRYTEQRPPYRGNPRTQYRDSRPPYNQGQQRSTDTIPPHRGQGSSVNDRYPHDTSSLPNPPPHGQRYPNSRQNQYHEPRNENRGSYYPNTPPYAPTYPASGGAERIGQGYRNPIQSGTAALLPFIDPDLPDGLDDHYKLMQHQKALAMMGGGQTMAGMLPPHLTPSGLAGNFRSQDRTSQSPRPSGRSQVWKNAANNLHPFENEGTDVKSTIGRNPAGESVRNTTENNSTARSRLSGQNINPPMREFTGKQIGANINIASGPPPPAPSPMLTSAGIFGPNLDQWSDYVDKMNDLRKDQLKMQVRQQQTGTPNNRDGSLKQHPSNSAGWPRRNGENRGQEHVNTPTRQGGQNEPKYTDISHGLREILKNMNISTQNQTYNSNQHAFPNQVGSPWNTDRFGKRRDHEKMENIQEAEIEIADPKQVQMRYMTAQGNSRTFIGSGPQQKGTNENAPQLSHRQVWSTPEGREHLRQDAVRNPVLTRQHGLLRRLGGIDMEAGEVELQSSMLKDLLAEVYRRGVMASRDGHRNPYGSAIWGAISNLANDTKNSTNIQPSPSTNLLHRVPVPRFFTRTGTSVTRITPLTHNRNATNPGQGLPLTVPKYPYNQQTHMEPYQPRHTANPPKADAQWPQQYIPQRSRIPTEHLNRQPNYQNIPQNTGKAIPHLNGILNSAQNNQQQFPGNTPLNPLLNYHYSETPATSRTPIRSSTGQQEQNSQTGQQDTGKQTGQLTEGQQEQPPQTGQQADPAQPMNNLLDILNTGFIDSPRVNNKNLMQAMPILPGAITSGHGTVTDSRWPNSKLENEKITQNIQNRPTAATIATTKVTTSELIPVQNIPRLPERPVILTHPVLNTPPQLEGLLPVNTLVHPSNTGGTPHTSTNQQQTVSQQSSTTAHQQLVQYPQHVPFVPSTQTLVQNHHTQGTIHSIHSNKGPKDSPALMMASVSENIQTVTEKLIQESTTRSSVVVTSVVTSSGFGIAVGVIIGLFVIMGPIGCIMCRVRDRSIQRRKKKLAAEASKSQEAGIMEAMIMNELGRTSPSVKKTEGARPKIRCDSGNAIHGSELQALQSKRETTTVTVH